MARSFQTGWEPGHLGVMTQNAQGTIKTDFVSGGAYSYAGVGFGADDNRNGGILLASQQVEFYVRFHFYRTASTDRGILSFWSPNNVAQLVLDSSAGKLRFTRGWNGTVLATAAQSLVLNTWHLVEVHVKIDGTVGVVECRIDGSASGQGIAATSSLNTKNDGATANVQYLYLPDDQGRYDDLAVNDVTGSVNNTWIGEGKIVGLVPTAAGDVTTLNNQVGSATHWQNVDEVPPNDATDYNYDDAATGTNHYDLYNLTDPSNVGSVNAIQTWIRAQKSDAGTGNIRFVHKTQSTEYRDAADIALTLSWAYYTQIRELNPNTGVAWTATDLTNLQAGVDAR
jgi:hypothetical protein